ncbi:hypothetical protein HMI54_012725 [Coelomomyces lativittatus]|nr:hypothetical protein HMI54_012725 [Coelomomyces lativittatus]
MKNNSPKPPPPPPCKDVNNTQSRKSQKKKTSRSWLPPGQLPGDYISQRRRCRFQKDVQQMKLQEQKVREFHAHPLPTSIYPTSSLSTSSSSSSKAPPSSSLTPTFPPFKAQPIPEHVWTPFMPSKSTRPVTTTETVVLHTAHRQVLRQAFDQAVLEKEHERHRAQLRERQRQQALWVQELKVLRQRLVHRPTPLPKYLRERARLRRRWRVPPWSRSTPPRRGDPSSSSSSSSSSPTQQHAPPSLSALSPTQ